MGHRRRETGARGSQETGDGRHGEDRRQKKGDRKQKKGDGRPCSDVKSGCTKIELLLFLK